MYFIHNKYDKSSREMLESIPKGTTVIDFFEEREKYKNLNTSNMPCLVEELEFLEFPESEPESSIPELESKPELTEAELTIMSALAENYEQQMRTQENQLAVMAAIADMYEQQNGGESNA